MPTNEARNQQAELLSEQLEVCRLGRLTVQKTTQEYKAALAALRLKLEQNKGAQAVVVGRPQGFTMDFGESTGISKKRYVTAPVYSISDEEKKPKTMTGIIHEVGDDNVLMLATGKEDYWNIHLGQIISIELAEIGQDGIPVA